MNIEDYMEGKMHPRDGRNEEDAKKLFDRIYGDARNLMTSEVYFYDMIDDRTAVEVAGGDEKFKVTVIREEDGEIKFVEDMSRTFDDGGLLKKDGFKEAVEYVDRILKAN